MFSRTLHASALLMLVLCSLSPAWAGLEFRQVWPEKIYCKPGETAKMIVEVANTGTSPAAATFVVEIVSDLATSTQLASQDLHLAANESVRWEGSWQAEPVLGCELRATLLQDGKPLVSQSEYFSCAENVHQVLMMGSGSHGGWQFSGTSAHTPEYPEQFAMENHRTYGNFAEKFAWGPSDFDDLTPEEDTWWAGQTTYNESKPAMLAIINAFHRHDIQAITYGKASAGGTAGFELLRRSPDLAGYADGHFWGDYNVASLDFFTVLGPPKTYSANKPLEESSLETPWGSNIVGGAFSTPGTPEEMEKAGYTGAGKFAPYTKGGQQWSCIWYSCDDPRVADIGIGELVGSANMFGFDGVRFDGEFFAGRYQRLDGSWSSPEETYDAEKANVALVQRMKQQCWAADPDYLFGYNATTEITWSIGLDNVPLSFREKCKDDGLIADESYAFPGNVPWLEYLLRVRKGQELVRYYGGHYATYPFERNGNNLYNFVGQYALRSHMMGAYTNEYGADWMRRSPTRFAGILFDKSLTTWFSAPGVVDVQSSHDLWWKEFAAIGEAPGGGTRYIIHLINPPKAPTTGADIAEQVPMAPAQDVKVAIAGLGNVTQAYLVDMENTTASPLTPQDGSYAIGTVPVWKILVIDVEMPRPAPVYEQAAAEASLTTPTAAELGLTYETPKAPENTGTVLEGESASLYKIEDPEASGGAAALSQPSNGPMAFSGYLYTNPGPGYYRATFRLKVKPDLGELACFEMQVVEWQNNLLEGVPQLHGDIKRLHAKDFKAPMQYQDFTTNFSVSDTGFREIRVVDHGSGGLYFDKVTIELVRPWMQEDLDVHYSGVKPSASLGKISAKDGFKVLAVRGLWNRLYRIDDIVAALPNSQLSEGYIAVNMVDGFTISGFDWGWKSLWNQNVIVLANAETCRMDYGRFSMLREWVRNGGALIILGGLTTLGQANAMSTGWPDLLPITLNGPWEIRKCDTPVAFAGAKEDSPPVVLYRHMVKVRKDAKVLLRGKNQEPLLVGMPYGKGKVVVFTGTVLGEAPAGMREFWTTPEWTTALRNAILWATGEKK